MRGAFDHIGAWGLGGVSSRGGTIRAAGVRGFATEVRILGADPTAFVRAVGLAPEVLDHDDIPIAEARLVALLEKAAGDLACPDLGLRIAARHDLGMLGPLALVIANSGTAEQAFVAATRYLGFHSDALRLWRTDDPHGDPRVVAIRYDGHDPVVPPVQAMDAGLGFVHRALELMLGENYGLVSVELSYEPAAPLEVYRTFYGVPVATGAGAAFLRVRAGIFDQPILGARDSLRVQAETYLRTLLPDPADVVARVQRIIRETLVIGSVPLPTVARMLRIEPRTLQRRLADLGVSFTRIVDDVRRDEARRLLTLTDLSFLEVSSRLGFAEQATFSRASRRWWGVPPRGVRARSGTR